jgi:hypothetical protein
MLYGAVSAVTKYGTTSNILFNAATALHQEQL